MPDVIGIDPIYISVGDLARAEIFYDRAERRQRHDEWDKMP